MRRITIFAMASMLSLSHLYAQTPGFSVTEYKKALWMTTRMYGGQRSGENNWLLANHLPKGVDPSLKGKAFIHDKDGDYDLSGGWHDCGAHVKFGQTEFYSGYILLKGFSEIPTGYDDRYSHTYTGYIQSNQWNFEGNGHDPNGIPDILDEVKHATDYFIKCARNSTTFYYQVGQGNPDHKNWVTAVMMQTLSKEEGGQPRVAYKNPADASMPSFCGATLALMSRLYKKYDPVYAQKCLQHALYAYDYAKAHPGTAGTGDGGFYTADKNWKDDFVNLCSELYWTTGEAKYKTEAQSFTFDKDNGTSKDVYGNPGYGFDYQNNGDVAIYNLAKLGTPKADSILSLIAEAYMTTVLPDGQSDLGGSWGILRYNANLSFIVALEAIRTGKKPNTLKFIHDNIDYILGKNSANLSFVVGFGDKSAKFPHHRNVFLVDTNPPDAIKRTFVIPTKNKQHGYMVGGTRSPSTFNDDIVTYTHTEGGIDYNAGLVGALAYINAQLAPVDTNKFGSSHPKPTLGADRSLCGVGSILLDANVPTDGKKTFTWLQGTTVLVEASTTQNTYNVTSGGTYTCRIDSAGKWQTEDLVVISAAIPPVNLGPDKLLCDVSAATLEASVSGTAYTYTWWSKTTDQAAFTKELSQTGKTWSNIRRGGVYRVVVSATGCTEVQDDVVITSSLPTPVDGCAPAGVAQTLSITNPGLGTGSYDWYATPMGGTKVGSGTSLTVSPAATQTYYVQDASAIAGTAGLKTPLVSAQNWGINASNQLKFTLANTVTISSLKILADYYASSGTVSVEVLDANGNALSPVRKFVSKPLNLTSNSNVQLVTLNFDNFTIDKAWGTDLRLRIAEKSSTLNLNPYWNNAGASYPVASTPVGIMTITGSAGGDNDANNYMYFYDIQFSSGAVCSRLPVVAKVDTNCAITALQETDAPENLSIYPNPSTGKFTIGLENPVDKMTIMDVFGKKILEINSFGGGEINLEHLVKGVYLLKLEQGAASKCHKLIKE